MKDPRAKLYALLEEGEHSELMTETKAYMESIIGQSATAKSQAATDIETAQAGFDTQLAELKAAAPAAPPSGEYVSKAEFDAMKKDWDLDREAKSALEATQRTTKLSDALGSKLEGIDPNIKNAIITAMRTDGYSIGGKSFKASYDGESMLLDVDGESNSIESGISAIMEAGLSGMVSGAAGGGFPNFDSAGDSKPASFDDDINADLKS